MVLAGSINKEIVTAINAPAEGGRHLRQGRQHDRAQQAARRCATPSSNIEQVVDLGFVGEPVEVDPHVLDLIIRSDMIPVIAPVGVGPDGRDLNINADTFAGARRRAEAKRLLLLTDVAGVLDSTAS